jgi:hypothetical protein
MTPETKIEKVETNDYGSWQTIYVRADKDTIALILAFVAQLNTNTKN